MSGITAVRAEVVRARYRRPFQISSGASDDLVSVAVVVETDDPHVVGVGETTPMTAYTGETLAGIRSAIEDHLAPALHGHDAFDVAGAHERMDAALRGQRVAKAGIDLALHDLVGSASGLPVHLLLGGRVRDQVPICWVVGLASFDEMVADAAEHAAAGFTHIKLKGGPDPAQDVRLVRTVRESLSAGVELSLDANEGYRQTTALRHLADLVDAGLDMVEQPLPHWDLAGLARLREHLPLRVMVDESVQSPMDALAVVRAGAADVVNVKVVKVGGLYRSRQVAAVAEAAGLAVKVGSMPELGVATLGALHLAAAVPGATVPADLVGPLLVDGDPLAPEPFADAATGWAKVPRDAGLGHTLDPERVRAVATAGGGAGDGR